MYWRYHILHTKSPAEMMGRPTRCQDEIQRVNPDIHLYSEIQRIIQPVTDSLKQTSEFPVFIYDLSRQAKLLAHSTRTQTKRDGMGVLLKLMAPVAPTFAEESWEKLR